MKITVIGAGYVGLVTAVCFAHGGHQVICLERKESLYQTLARGQCTILEKDLPQMLEQALEKKLLQFTTEAESSIPWGEIVFIAVGTPEGDGGRPDLDELLVAASEIGRFRREGQVVVIKSTVPPGTTQIVQQAIHAEVPISGCTSITQVVCNPEFLREGTAIDDFLSPDRIVVGTDDKTSGELIFSLYRPLLRKSVPEILTSTLHAELIKYASNSYLAVRLSYVNELAALCEKLGGDITEVARIIGLDRRIGNSYLSAGLGYGGACLPKDTQALAYAARNAGAPLTVLECAIAANQNIAVRLADRIAAVIPAGRTVAIWGLSFKSGTDDIRNSPVLTLMTELYRRLGCQFQIFDPASQFVHVHYPVELAALICRTLEESVSGAEALVIGTAWPQFREVDLSILSTRMSNRKIFDFVNLLNKDSVQRAGFDYYGCGRG